MNPWPVEAAVPEVHLPRPGHADLAGMQKYGFTDVRNVLERASARETAARVAGGALAKAFLRALGVEVVSHVTQIGSVSAPERGRPRARRLRRRRRVAGPLPRRRRPRRRWSRRSTCCASATSRSAASSSCAPSALVPGLGSHVSWEERLDGRIGARDALDPGDQGRRARRRLRPRRAGPGSEAHDEIFYSRGARLLPRDQPLRRARGRHDDGRAAGRARAR